eukprot:828784-Lingulodinium_polyedra.AAC.1
MQCDAMHCNAMHCNAMQYHAMHCNALQCTAMRCHQALARAVPDLLEDLAMHREGAATLGSLQNGA